MRLRCLALALGIAAASVANAQQPMPSAPWALDARLAASRSAPRLTPPAERAGMIRISQPRRAVAHVIAGAMLGAIVAMSTDWDDPLLCAVVEQQGDACPPTPKDKTDTRILQGTLLGGGAGLVIYLARRLSEEP